MTTKLITVYGGTGNQGGSVVRSLLRNPHEFSVRVISRNPSSEKSQELINLGAQVVRADAWESQSLVQAFQGAWGAFVNMNSDEFVLSDENSPSEFDMGKNIIDSAIIAGVQHLVFSSGPSCTDLTNGKVNMKAMNMKNKVQLYAQSLHKFRTITPICAGWFMENFLEKAVAPIFGGFPHLPDAEGFLTFNVPFWGGKEDVPWLSITDDFGDIAHGIFLEPERWNGQNIHGLSDVKSFEEMTRAFAAVSGRKSRFVPLLSSWEAFNTHDIPQLIDVKLMFGLTQTTGGIYFGEVTEKDTATALKAAGAHACGKSGEELRLKTLESWFERAVAKNMI
ncbi:hypothetical protein HYALB_00004278 [Hymenoscyphus albidus]|uniref:NmrA-like domain-containing protein n=1 Tax=Hymenoscyphus albidus TaxID=595503 RepID=A0A9N9LMI4_9HELO|nr:hypothetical protein HYALB_00004278 [Hymenoscyphus albidus]